MCDLRSVHGMTPRGHEGAAGFGWWGLVLAAWLFALFSTECVAATAEPAAARAAVAQALYAASATAAAEQRLADVRISQQRREIEALRGRLGIVNAREASKRTRLQGELADAQERYVQQLAARDRAFAQEIAVFRRAVQDIASTAEGEAALRQYNAGDEIGALAGLDKLVDAREHARRVRANVEMAQERRRVARLSLDAKNKGKVRADAVIARYEEVTRLDAGVHWDWIELSRLYGEAGRLPDAGRAALKAADTAEDQRDRSVALSELGDVLVEQGDLAGAKQRYHESLEIDKRLAVADPSSASVQRDLSVSLIKLGDVLVEQGDLAGAKQRYQESSDILKRLAVADPSSARLQRDLSVSLNKLADVLVAQGDLAGAKQRYQESLEIRKRLAAADPSSASLQRDVSAALWGLAAIKGSGVTWQQVAERLEALQSKGVLNPADQRYLEVAKIKAAAESRAR